MLIYKKNLKRLSFSLSKKIIVTLSFLFFSTQWGNSTDYENYLTNFQLENVKRTVSTVLSKGSIQPNEQEIIGTCADIGSNLYKQGLYKQARKHLEVVKDIMPNVPFYYAVCCEKMDPPDYVEAHANYLMMKDKSPAARHNLANLYQQGLGTQKNEQEAFELFLQNKIFFLQKIGNGSPDSNTEDYKSFIKNKLKDDLEIYIANTYLLGIAYLNGLGTEVNYEDAIKCLEEGVRFDDPEACVYLASIYQDGLGVERSCQTAFDLYKKASDLGNLTGKSAYADYLMECTGGVCEQDIDQAKALLEEITETNPDFWEHYIELSTLHFYHLDNDLLGVQYAIEYVQKLKQLDEFQSNTIRGIHHLMNILIYLINEGKDIEALQNQVQFFDKTLKELKEDLVEVLKGKIEKNEKYKSVAYYLSAMVAFNEKKYYKALDLLNTAYCRGYDDPSNLYDKINDKLQENYTQDHQDSVSLKAKKEKPDVIIKEKETLRKITVQFFDEIVEADYNALNPKGKLLEIKNHLETNNIWETTGPGKPEVLKHHFKGIKGAISRRLDDENRFVYQVIGKGVIKVLSCKGHYKE